MVNNINNNLNALNPSVNSSHLNKTNSTNAIDKIYEESLSLSINDYNRKRDELSIDIQAINEGIAISKISQDAISKQKEYLSNMQNTLESSKILDDKNSIRQKINEDLKAFNDITNSTKFKNEHLLKTNEDDSLSIFVNTKTQTYSFNKPDSEKAASNIFEMVNSLDLNNQTNLNASIYQVNDAYNKLDNTYKELSSLNTTLEDNAKENIKEQFNLYKNINKKDINFGNEISDFSKTNITSNMGHLLASQANIVQAQSVRLLS